MEAPDQVDTGQESVKLIKVRSDLQDYFEVVSHCERTLRCKLCGTDSSETDGASGIFRFDSSRGWYNFERHLKRHNVAKGRFSGESITTKRERKDKSPKKNKNTPKTTNEFRRTSCDTEVNWQNLFSKERRCLVCLTDVDNVEEQFDHEKLKILFPGCEGSKKLSQQLFFIFFLRNIAEFPAEKCVRLLKKCRGLRTPETWFSLCAVCREVILQAAAIHGQLILLQNTLNGLKTMARSRFQENTMNGIMPKLSGIEEEIRKHLNDAVDEGTANVDVHSDLIIDDNFENELPSESIDQEWSTANKLLEIDPDCTFTRRQRKCIRKICKDYLDTDDEIDNPKEKPMTATDVASQNVPSIIEVKPDLAELKIVCIQSDTEENMKNNCLNSNQENDELLISHEEVDDDFEVTPCEILELDSEDSDYVSKNSKKLYRKSSFRKVKTKSDSLRQHQPKSKAAILKRGSYSYRAKCGANNEGESEVELYVCQFCPSKYKTRGSLREHLEAHEISKTQGNKFDCPQCGYPCHSERAQLKHFNMKHGEGESRCTLCDYKSRCRKQFNLHLKEHKEKAERERVDGKYLCKHCNRLFITYAVLCKHKRTMHYQEIGVIPYQCEYCSLILSTKRLLQDHVQQVHRKQSRYFCDLCGIGTLQMSHLRRHMVTHKREKNFVCEICGADFQYAEVLRQHRKREHPQSLENSGNNPFTGGRLDSRTFKHICKHCGCEYASATLLRRHIKSHTELFQNKCDLCGKGYATHQSLRRHKEINHAKREVPCTFCGKKFPHQEYIRSHYKFCKQYPQKKKNVLLSDGEPIGNSCSNEHDYDQSFEEKASKVI